MISPLADPEVDRIELDEVLEQLQHLPALPTVAQELFTMSDDEVDVQLLVQRVSQDQALAAKALQIANSSFYGAQAKVTTLRQAVTLLGTHNIRHMITTAALSNCFPKGHCAGFDFDAFWRHSIGVAICARVLAMHLRLNLDYTYTAGLLHDIGRLLLVTRFPHHYEAAIAYRVEHDCHMLEAEATMIGVDHAAAGSALARHWNFSEQLQKAIAEHHDPGDAGHGSLAAIIHVADCIAHALDLSQAADDLVPPVSATGWQCLGMRREAYLHAFRETELEFVQASRILPM
jgi:putative nucleotidyltransferase with HDIG domain